MPIVLEAFRKDVYRGCSFSVLDQCFTDEKLTMKAFFPRDRHLGIIIPESNISVDELFIGLGRLKVA